MQFKNGVRKNGDNFRKLTLNATQDRIVDVEILDADPSRLKVPLTFCIAEGQAVVIGNSNLEFMDQENFGFPERDSLRHTRLIIYDL